jgi:uncharacterized membrane protein YjfL (UPF0719 family)
MDGLGMLIGPLSMGGGVLILLVVLAGFLWATGKLEGYDPVNEMLFRDNPALGLRYALFVIAVIFALLGIFDRAQGDSGAADFIAHALLAIVLLYFSRFLNDWFILYHFNNNREVVQEKNVAVALVEGATYLASAYIIAGAFYDWESGLTAALLWFVIGQVLLVILAFFFRLISSNADTELDDRNLAVGIALAAFLLAGGIVCGAVISGPSKGWKQDSIAVAIYVVSWIAVMLAAHWLSDRLAFRASKLGEEVSRERNIAAALFKAVIFLAVTLGFTHG